MATSIQAALRVGDLTLDRNKPIWLLLEVIKKKFSYITSFEIRDVVISKSPFSNYFDSFDVLGYEETSRVRGEEHTFKVNESTILLPHISGLVFPYFSKAESINDGIYVFSGLVYQKGKRGIFHQTDVWIISDTEVKIDSVSTEFAKSILKNFDLQIKGSELPYIDNCKSLKLSNQSLREVTLLKYGEVSVNFKERVSLLKKRVYAFGLGMDRTVSLIKGFNDQNLIRSEVPWIADQMHNLDPLKAPLKFQPVSRDISLICKSHESDKVISLTKDTQDLFVEVIIDKVTLVSKQTYNELSEFVRNKLLMGHDECNLVLRVTLISLTKTLNKEECSALINKLKDYLNLQHGVRLI